jgi:hypothetical protein
VGTANTPYLTSLLTQCAMAGKYYANAHPSIHYLIMTIGQAITTTTASPTRCSDNVGREFTAAGKS